MHGQSEKNYGVFKGHHLPIFEILKQIYNVLLSCATIIYIILKKCHLQYFSFVKSDTQNVYRIKKQIL